MAESVIFQRFRLDFRSPWDIGGDAVHNWSVKFSCSGGSNCPQVDQEATALALAQPIREMISTLSAFIGWDHYPIGSATHDYGKTYPPATYPGLDTAWTGGGNAQQLEVCALAEAYCGQSSKGRPVYLRKWIHDVKNETSHPNNIQPLVDMASLLLPWNNGAGPHNLVPVSPTTGSAGQGWTISPHLYTHQLRRGYRKKVVKSGTSVIPGVNDLETVLKLYEKLAGATP